MNFGKGKKQVGCERICKQLGVRNLAKNGAKNCIPIYRIEIYVLKSSTIQSSNIVIVGYDRFDEKVTYLLVNRNSNDYELVFTSYRSKFESKNNLNKTLLEIFSNIYGKINTKTDTIEKTHSGLFVFGIFKLITQYYVIIVTKAKLSGYVSEHELYEISQSTTVSFESILNCGKSTNIFNNKLENNYLKIFQQVNINSNFYFSYTYPINHTAQYNFAESHVCNKELCTYYVWNWYHLKALRKHRNTGQVARQWFMPVIYGFMEQTVINIYEKKFFVLLIARRSRKFVGTRYLKRGCDSKGNAANHVESEQIVSEFAAVNSKRQKISSFVQLRGSVPFHWTQVPLEKSISTRPPIQVVINDPYCCCPRMHFRKLSDFYRSKITCLNLLKTNEKKPKENILTSNLNAIVHYLNQFIPHEQKIDYIQFDMARIKKRKSKFSFIDLWNLADRLIEQSKTFFTGFDDNSEMTVQRSIVRSNCVDCLDRTNIAQFLIGLRALRHQFQQMEIEDFDESQIKQEFLDVLEQMYDNHGDILAIQYGGSQTAHRIKTYLQQSAWNSRSRDMLQTISRYYSNRFQDNDKQISLNLFLGVYRPYELKNSSIYQEHQGDSFLIGNMSNFNITSIMPLSSYFNRNNTISHFLDIHLHNKSASMCGENKEQIASYQVLIQSGAENEQFVCKFTGWYNFELFENFLNPRKEIITTKNEFFIDFQSIYDMNKISYMREVPQFEIKEVKLLRENKASTRKYSKNIFDENPGSSRSESALPPYTENIPETKANNEAIRNEVNLIFDDYTDDMYHDNLFNRFILGKRRFDQVKHIKDYFSMWKKLLPTDAAKNKPTNISNKMNKFNLNNIIQNIMVVDEEKHAFYRNYCNPAFFNTGSDNLYI